MATATNGNGANGSGGGVKISLRLQYYCILLVAAALLVGASFRFMPAAAAAAVRLNFRVPAAPAAAGAARATADATGGRKARADAPGAGGKAFLDATGGGGKARVDAPGKAFLDATGGGGKAFLDATGGGGKVRVDAPGAGGKAFLDANGGGEVRVDGTGGGGGGGKAFLDASGGGGGGGGGGKVIVEGGEGGGEVGGGGGGGRRGVVVFNFGDSNSDTGGVAAAMGIHIAPPEGRAYFHRPTGRLSDGRVIVDFICESLNISHLSPYLKPLGADFRGGVNFAIAGSTATPGGSPFSLNIQVDQFLFFKDRSLELINQGLKAPIDEEGFRNALYTMDIGQNDVTPLFGLPHHQMLARFTRVVAEIRTAVQALYSSGGRKFWIHGTGALGCLPAQLAMPRRDDSGLDEHGCIRAYNDAAKAFNAELSNACDGLRLQLRDATVVYTDLFAIKYDLVANHTAYGIERPLMTCCGVGGPPYNFNPTKSCMAVDAQLCAPGDKFISWDGVHFTDFANGVVAGKILTGDYSKPRVRLASLVGPAN